MDQQQAPALSAPDTRTYDEETSKVMGWWGVAGGIAATLSVLVCVLAAHGSLPSGKMSIGLLAAAWAILPPVWFWWEYFYVYRTTHSKLGTWDYFKHGQQLGVAVWAGVAASIAVFAISPLSDPQDKSIPKLECKLESVKAAQSSEPTVLEIKLRCSS